MHLGLKIFQLHLMAIISTNDGADPSVSNEEQKSQNDDNTKGWEGGNQMILE